MKKYRIYICLLFTACLSMTACSKDNEDSGLDNWKLKNEQAFKDLANDPSFTELKSEGDNGSIYYRVIKKGSGKQIFYTSRVQAYYKGSFVTDYPDKKIKEGTVFDQKLFDDGAPLKVAVSKGAETNYPGTTAVEYAFVMLGWTVALQGMVEGDQWEVRIPYRFGYGEKGSNSIPGYSTLAFEIEVVKVLD